MNVNKLKSKIVENGYTIREFGTKCGLKPTALYRKLADVTDFKRKEINSIIHILGLTQEEVFDIFFADEVA